MLIEASRLLSWLKSGFLIDSWLMITWSNPPSTVLVFAPAVCVCVSVPFHPCSVSPIRWNKVACCPSAVALKLNRCQTGWAEFSLLPNHCKNICLSSAWHWSFLMSRLSYTSCVSQGKILPKPEWIHVLDLGWNLLHQCGCFLEIGAIKCISFCSFFFC